MVKRLLFCAYFIFSGLSLWAQTDYKQEYLNAKALFRQGKYNLAMESFKPLISYDANNPFPEYASFYYALSAYNQKYFSVARDMFNQIKKLYPSWDKMPEVNFWLGKVYMDSRDYFQGLQVWRQIKNNDLQKTTSSLKREYLSQIEDAETLRMMLEEFPDDVTIARALAKVLSRNVADADTRTQLEALIKKYKFERGDFINEAPPSYKKDVYTVAAVFPFMVNTLEPTAATKRNQVILDFYQGLTLALDTLNEERKLIELRTYDTERSATTLGRLLETQELKTTDLLIGPFFQEENSLLQKFSFENRINVFTPFTNNYDWINHNEFGYLYQPSYETLGRKSAMFVNEALSEQKKNCMVFYGTSKKDSLQAAAFSAKARELGLNVVSMQRLSKEATGKIVTILATPTEYDKWKKPIEFTLKKDSLRAIYVASDEPLLYTKVISSVETRGDSILVVGSEEWLAQSAIELDKYNTLDIILASPNYMDTDTEQYQRFIKKYIKKHGRVPSLYAKIGYELMLFTGTMLNKSGVYFQESFNKEGNIDGFLTEGFNYQFSRDNQLIPFVKFEDGTMRVVSIQ